MTYDYISGNVLSDFGANRVHFGSKIGIIKRGFIKDRTVEAPKWDEKNSISQCEIMRGAHNLIIYPSVANARAFGLWAARACVCTRVCAYAHVRACACEGIQGAQERASPPAAYARSQLRTPTWLPLLCCCCCIPLCLCCPVPCNTFCMCLCHLPLCCLLLTCCPISKLEEVCYPKMLFPLGGPWGAAFPACPHSCLKWLTNPDASFARAF